MKILKNPIISIILLILWFGNAQADFVVEETLDVNGDGTLEKIITQYYQIKTIVGLTTIKIFDQTGNLLFISTPSDRSVNNVWTFYKIVPDHKYPNLKMIIIASPDANGFWLASVFRWSTEENIFKKYIENSVSEVKIPTFKTTDTQEFYQQSIQVMQQKVIDDTIARLKLIEQFPDFRKEGEDPI